MEIINNNTLKKLFDINTPLTYKSKYNKFCYIKIKYIYIYELKIYYKI